MKMQLTKTLTAKLCFMAFLMTISFRGFASSHLSMTIENCSASKDEIQFDFMVQNDGDVALKFNSGSFRLVHDAAIVPAGNNSFTFSYIEGTSDFSRAFATRPGSYNVNYNAEKQMMQLTMSSNNFSSSTAIAIPADGKAMRVGRFSLKITNGSWVPGAEINTAFHPTGNGILAYVDGSKKTTAFEQTWAIEEGSNRSTTVRDPYSEAAGSSVAKVTNVPLSTSGNYAGKPNATSTLTIDVKSMCRIAGKDETFANGIFTAYPNPTAGKSTISFTTEQSGKYLLKVVDMVGKVLLSEDISAVEGFNTKNINLENVAKGVYVISLQTEGSEPHTMQLVVN